MVVCIDDVIASVKVGGAYSIDSFATYSSTAVGRSTVRLLSDARAEDVLKSSYPSSDCCLRRPIEQSPPIDSTCLPFKISKVTFSNQESEQLAMPNAIHEGRKQVRWSDLALRESRRELKTHRNPVNNETKTKSEITAKGATEGVKRRETATITAPMHVRIAHMEQLYATKSEKKRVARKQTIDRLANPLSGFQSTLQALSPTLQQRRLLQREEEDRRFNAKSLTVGGGDAASGHKMPKTTAPTHKNVNNTASLHRKEVLRKKLQLRNENQHLKPCTEQIRIENRSQSRTFLTLPDENEPKSPTFEGRSQTHSFIRHIKDGIKKEGQGNCRATRPNQLRQLQDVQGAPKQSDSDQDSNPFGRRISAKERASTAQPCERSKPTAMAIRKSMKIDAKVSRIMHPHCISGKKILSTDLKSNRRMWTNSGRTSCLMSELGLNGATRSNGVYSRSKTKKERTFPPKEKALKTK